MSYFEEAGIKDLQTGHQVFADHFHNMSVTSPVRLVGAKFIGTTKDTNFWTEAVTGTGAVAQAAGLVTLTTGATANSTASYTTVRKARFVPATTNVFRYVGLVSNTGSANNIRQWGMYDSQNGLFFQLSGTTLNIVTRAGGSDTPVAQAAWDNPTSFTLDANIHGFHIYASYRTADFYIDDILVHSINVSGAAALKWQSLDVPAVFSNANSNGGTANVTMSSALCTIFRLGEIETETIYKNITGNAATWVLKYGAGRLHRIIFNNTTGTSFIIYDNTSAATPIIGTLTTAAGFIGSHDWDLAFNNGLTIVTTGNGLDLTVVYE